MSIKCYKCNQVLNLDAAQNIGRSEECNHCGADLRCCKMCQFYDVNSYNECREPVAERIVEKEKANYCDFFKLGHTTDSKNDKANLFNAADALFKK